MSARLPAGAAFVACAAVALTLGVRANAQPAAPSSPQPVATATPFVQPPPSAGPVPGASPTPLPSEPPVPAGTSATPVPGAPATPVPSASEPPAQPSGPVATAQPTNAPSRALRFDRGRAGVAPGAVVRVGVSGAAGPVIVRVQDPTVVDARYEPATRSLVLAGRAPGRTSVQLSDAAGNAASLAVLVAPPAGVIPGDVTVELAGTVTPAFALSKIRAAIAAQAQLQPQATLDVHGVQIDAPLQPGSSLEAQARVRVGGGDAFVDALGVTNVHVHVDALDPLSAALLFYSDDPERLGAGADGVLYRNDIAPDRTARAYVYHVSDVPGRRLYLTLRAVDGPARVQILGYAAGPATAFAYVGHVSTVQYLLAHRSQESAVVAVAPDSPLAMQLGYRALGAGDLVAAIFDLRVLEGSRVDVAVVAASGSTDPLEELDGSELPGDGHGRRGEFSLVDVPPLALTFAAGGPEPAPFTVGVPTIQNERPGGKALGGDYGVLRNVALQLSNPSPDPQTVYFYETPSGGGVTTTIWFDGDDRPTEVPCAHISGARYLVKAFSLAPGESRVVGGDYMTDGTSSFPLAFGMTSVPPTPAPSPGAPDSCNPQPAASPLPSASPGEPTPSPGTFTPQPGPPPPSPPPPPAPPPPPETPPATASPEPPGTSAPSATL